MKKRNLLAGILVGVMAMTALAGCRRNNTITAVINFDNIIRHLILKQTVTSRLYQEKTAVVQEAHS